MQVACVPVCYSSCGDMGEVAAGRRGASRGRSRGASRGRSRGRRVGPRRGYRRWGHRPYYRPYRPWGWPYRRRSYVDGGIFWPSYYPYSYGTYPYVVTQPTVTIAAAQPPTASSSLNPGDPCWIERDENNVAGIVNSLGNCLALELE